MARVVRVGRVKSAKAGRPVKSGKKSAAVSVQASLPVSPASPPSPLSPVLPYHPQPPVDLTAGFRMPDPSDLFHPVPLDVSDVTHFQRSQFVREWVRKIRSEIYLRSRRRSKDDGDWRELQGFIRGLEYALALPTEILTEMTSDEESSDEQ